MTQKTPKPGVKTTQDRDGAGMPRPPAKPVAAENQETRGEKPRKP